MTDKNNQSNHEDTEQCFDALLDKASAVDAKYGVSVSKSDEAAAFQKISRQAGLRSPTSFSSYTSFMRYVAAAVLLIGVIGLGYLMIPNRILVPKGETRVITLSDETTITLNSGSELTYPKWFNIWGRTVSLNGEAFFEVSHSGLPFRVEAGRGLITVTGTEFNVRSWPGTASNTTSVFLKEGSISFSSIDQETNPVMLKPRQFSQLSPKKETPSPPQNTEASKAMAWMQQALAFDKQPLSAIFGELDRRFDIKIKVESKGLLQETLTLYITDVKNAEQILGDICRAKGLSYTKDGHTFTVSKSY